MRSSSRSYVLGSFEGLRILLTAIQGYFVWPREKWRPELIFPALDFIRTKHSCYINYEAASGSFRVMGAKKNVSNALITIKGGFCQTVARDLKASKIYLLHQGATFYQGVGLARYYPTQVRNSPKGTAYVYTPRGQGRLSHKEVLRRPDQSKCFRTLAKNLQKQVMEGLGKTRYYHGSLTFCIRLGTFVLKHYEDKVGDDRSVHDVGYNMAAFETMIDNARFSGEVTQE